MKGFRWPLLLVPLGYILFIYLLIAGLVAANNATKSTYACEHIDGVPSKEATGKTWVANPLTIGLTGECKEKL
jgi:hypothetical protein